MNRMDLQEPWLDNADPVDVLEQETPATNEPQQRNPLHSEGLLAEANPADVLEQHYEIPVDDEERAS